MIYVLGGASRSGKTLLARRAVDEKRIPYFPLDALFGGLAGGAPQLGVTWNQAFIERGEKMWPIVKSTFGFLTFFLLNTIIKRSFLNEYYYVFTSIEAFLIISFALNLYVHLIFDDNLKDFKNSPPFLINTSLFFFFSYTFPFYFFDFFLSERLPAFFVLNKAINGMAYIIFYLLLIKSLRCKIKLSK